MSLINDALKKAQKQRTGDAPALASMPGVGGESAAKIAKRARPVGFNSMLARLGVAAGAVALLVVGGIFLAKSLRSHPEPEAAPKPPATVKVEAPKPAPSVPTAFVLPIAPPPAPAAETAPASPAPAPATTTTVATAAPPIAATPKPDAVAPAPVVTKETAPAPVAEPVVAAAPPPAAARPVDPPPRLDTRSVNFIESLRIAGIRASATDSKVLMNDRVYRVGDIVEHDMGLRLTGITSSSLTFENDRGASYTRNF